MLQSLVTRLHSIFRRAGCISNHVTCRSKLACSCEVPAVQLSLPDGPTASCCGEGTSCVLKRLRLLQAPMWRSVSLALVLALVLLIPLLLP